MGIRQGVYIAVEVGSRGLLVEDELSQIQDILRAPGRAITELYSSINFKGSNTRIIPDLVF